MASIQTSIAWAISRFAESKLANAAHNQTQDFRQDAEQLMRHCLQKNSAYLRTWPEQELQAGQAEKFEELVKKRCELYPLAYLLGSQGFWSMELEVNPNVLIPRPETECLIEWILSFFSHRKENLKLLDLGTGSGAIALALAHEKPGWQIHASDQSEQALKVAQSNAKRLVRKTPVFHLSNWFEKIPPMTFDCIVSNPPYVEEGADEFETEAIQWEPKSALAAGKDGLQDIHTICAQAGNYLAKQAPLLVEHGHQQGQAVNAIFTANNFSAPQCYQDYAGLDRFTVGFRS